MVGENETNIKSVNKNTSFVLVDFHSISRMGGPSYILILHKLVKTVWLVTAAGFTQTTGSGSCNGGQQEERLQQVKHVPLFI